MKCMQCAPWRGNRSNNAVVALLFISYFWQSKSSHALTPSLTQTPHPASDSERGKEQVGSEVAPSWAMASGLEIEVVRGLFALGRGVAGVLCVADAWSLPYYS